jgi:cephalosporin-C deacetylase-like acetyl esterase
MWGLNLVRRRTRRPGEAEQYSAWSPFTWSALRPDKFGTLWLPKADAFPELGSREELERLARAGSRVPQPEAPQPPAAIAKFDWTVLSAARAEQIQATAMTYNYLSMLRDRQYAERDRALAEVKTWEDWQKWRKNVLATVHRVVGPFPEEDCALSPRVSVAFENKNIRIERLIYESRPRFYVTANVYVPKPDQGEKFPAVVRVVGHSTSGRLGRSVIRQCVDLALSGYLVLSLDFPGQGERIYTNHGYGSRTPTRNHYAIGAPCVLTGTYLASYFIHDVLRGLDYLGTRGEVDMKRVVMTGSSGGGTLTSYVAAVDDRIAAAAPVSALGCTRLAGGNYDSEQVLYDYVRLFMDSEGRCSLTAPRPLTVIREVHGEDANRRHRESFERARRIYALNGAGSRLTYVPTSYPHGYNNNHYRLFRKWLAEVMPPNRRDAPRPPTPRFSYDRVRATKSWRVYYTRELPDRETVWSVNAKQIDLPLAFEASVTSPAQAGNRRRKIAEALRELLCLRLPEEAVKAESLGQSAAGAYRVEKLILHTDPGVVVPAILVKPKGRSDATPAVVWVSGVGKTAAVVRRWSTIRALVDAGVAVLLPDVRAVGETSPGGDPTFQGPETSLNGFSYRLGTPLIGMRVRDVVCCVRYLQGRPDVRKAKVGLLGDSLSPLNPSKMRHRRLLIDPGLEPLHRADSLGPTLALLAFAFDESVACCATHAALASYASICRESHFYHPLNCFVPGILRRCDLADVCASAAPRPLMLAGSVNGLNQRLDTVGQDRTTFRNTRLGYRLLGASDRLVIDPDGGAAEAAEFLKRRLTGGGR